MGLRGPQPKPDHLRQRRNKPKSQLVLRAGAGAPKPPDGLLPVTLQRWETYWNSELAQAVRDAHIPMVERLFQRYDERERAYRTIRLPASRGGGRVVEGSQGQLVPHPLLKYIDSCDAEIRQLEDRLGLSPRTMAQLGMSFAKAQQTLDDLNKSMEDNPDSDSDGDPRIAVVN